MSFLRGAGFRALASLRPLPPAVAKRISLSAASRFDFHLSSRKA